MQNTAANKPAALQPSKPRRFASLFPPATHLAYASDMLRLREQRAAANSNATDRRQVAR